MCKTIKGRAARLLTLAALAICSSSAMAGEALDRIKRSGKVVIAHREASVPFSYLDGDGKPVGYAMDICMRMVEAIAKKLEVKKLAVEYLMVSSMTRIASIVDAKADLECESTTNTAERREKVAFTIPHYITGARYAVRANSPISEITHFSGKRLVSTSGTSPLKALRKADAQYQMNIQISEVPDHARGIEMVEQGIADGFLMDEVLLYGLIKALPDPTKLKVVGRYLTIEPLAIMLSRDDAELKRIVDDEMRRLIYSREAHKLHDRWFTQPIPPSGRVIGLPMPYLLRDFWKYPTDKVPN